MQQYNISKSSSFYALGLSYKKADADIRGRFSLDENSKINLLNQAKENGIESLVITSTCNRTEIYGFAQHPFQLIQLLCENTKGTVEEFQKVAYIYKNSDAISHMFRVGSGLDSQILGDFEIISQIKKSAIVSKKLNLLNPFLERLVNAVIQASKRIKTETEISSGATSVSFASVQYIFNNVEDISNKNILLFGTGKIGRNTCENLVKHTKNERITLINRTKNTAENIGGKFNLVVKDYANLQEEITLSDILIVATGAQRPTIDKHIVQTEKPILILDLSIPKNVSENVKENPLVTLVHLDELSKMTDRVLNKRKEQLPAAKRIIREVEEEFLTWAAHRQFAPMLKALKIKLQTIKEGEIDFQKKKLDGFNEAHADVLSDRLIHKITTQIANHLKGANGNASHAMEALKQVLELET